MLGLLFSIVRNVIHFHKGTQFARVTFMHYSDKPSQVKKSKCFSEALPIEEKFDVSVTDWLTDFEGSMTEMILHLKRWWFKVHLKQKQLNHTIPYQVIPDVNIEALWVHWMRTAAFQLCENCLSDYEFILNHLIVMSSKMSAPQADQTAWPSKKCCVQRSSSYIQRDAWNSVSNNIFCKPLIRVMCILAEVLYVNSGQRPWPYAGPMCLVSWNLSHHVRDKSPIST